MIIAVDFDGTLCTNEWPNIGAPRRGVIAYVKWRKENGAKLILWTNRTDLQLHDAIWWCREQGIEFDAVCENLPEIVEMFGGDSRKIFADEYIDDKAVLPDSLERTFRIRKKW